MVGEAAEDDEDVVHVTVRADLDELAICRDRVTAFLEHHDVSEARIEELRLVVSELASNVVRHTDRTTIDMTMSATDDWFELDVAGGPPGEILHAAANGSAPPSSQFSGRGLMIAHGVADLVDTVDIDGERVTRCQFRRG